MSEKTDKCLGIYLFCGKCKMQEDIEKLVQVAREIGQCPEFVQGGGGNASVKIGEQKLVIKASGYRLGDITTEAGLVILDYPKIRDYYNQLNLKAAVSEQAEIEFLSGCIIEKIGGAQLRPSIETGFHVLLPKFVLHTHSVYANIVSCSQNGPELLEQVFQNPLLKIIWIPYQHPGVYLALQIKEELRKIANSNEKTPAALLIQNHGLIVSGQTAEKLLKIHQEITAVIKRFFNITEPYPQPKLIQLGENIFESGSEFLKNFIKMHHSFCLHFDQHVLFPDQIVFCADFCVSDNLITQIEKAKIFIDTKIGKLCYHTNFKEALAIEETILAWAYIIEQAEAQGIKLSLLGNEAKDYITNMEMEKHRKKLMK